MASYVMTVATLAYIHRLFTEVKLQPATAGAEETEEQSEAVVETEDASSWAEGDGRAAIETGKWAVRASWFPVADDRPGAVGNRA